MNAKYVVIILSTIAGLSTTIGSIFMLVNKKYKNQALSFTFSF